MTVKIDPICFIALLFVVAEKTAEFRFQSFSFENMAEEEYQNRLKTLATKLPDGTFKCTICSQVGKYLRVITTHIEGRHLRTNRYKCRYCEKRFHSLTSKAMHIHTFHRELSLIDKSFGTG